MGGTEVDESMTAVTGFVSEEEVGGMDRTGSHWAEWVGLR